MRNNLPKGKSTQSVAGVFTISLDFELHWGGFEKWRLPQPVSGSGFSRLHRDGLVSGFGDKLKKGGYLPVDKSSYRNYFLNTRLVIPEMLQLFEKHEAHVTWATVGMLFHENKKSLLENAPSLKPTYDIQKLSAYHYIENIGIGENEAEDPFHYAPSLIKKIIDTPYQELATHTFGHYYCNESGQTLDQFQDDLKAAQRSAALYGEKMQSLVFPRNQFNDDVLKICFQEGIKAVRTNPLHWFWKIDGAFDESIWKRLNRGLDAYIPTLREHSYKLESIIPAPGYPLFIPASRLLRRYNPKELFFNDLRIQRIKSEITHAAKRGELYHLWWHPHNFGHYPEQSLRDLTIILDHYAYCQQQYGMTSLNMGEITERVLAMEEVTVK